MTTGKDSRCLGLIGGLGPFATSHYYLGLVRNIEAAGRIPRLLVAHADVDTGRGFVERKDLEGLAAYLAGFAAETKAGGAEMTAFVAITPHIAAREFVARSPLPFIDMVSEVADEVRRRGLKRIAMLGTRFTIESRMFGRLGDVEIAMPKPAEVDFIHTAYLDMVAERHTPAQVDGLRRLAHTLIERDGAECVLLAGTDLMMEFNAKNIDFPSLDCAAVHIAAITKRMVA
jgi:aspartate racemase